MSYANMVLHLDRGPRASARIDVALAIATRHKARVSALYSSEPIVLPRRSGDGFIPEDLLKSIIENNRAASAAEAKTVMTAFTEAAAKANVPVTWREVVGDPSIPLARAGRAADLIVVGQSSGDVPATEVPHPGLAEDIAMASGAPVLCVPYVGNYTKLGDRIMVAWDGSRECARAMRDALPMLLKASHVMVCSVGDVPAGRPELAEVGAFLQGHGVKGETHRLAAGGIDVGSALLSALADYGIDLMVMGCYGHSRAREFIWGGATRSLLRHMTVPVLFAH